MARIKNLLLFLLSLYVVGCGDPQTTDESTPENSKTKKPLPKQTTHKKIPDGSTNPPPSPVPNPRPPALPALTPLPPIKKGPFKIVFGTFATSSLVERQQQLKKIKKLLELPEMQNKSFRKIEISSYETDVSVDQEISVNGDLADEALLEFLKKQPSLEAFAALQKTLHQHVARIQKKFKRTISFGSFATKTLQTRVDLLQQLEKLFERPEMAQKAFQTITVSSYFAGTSSDRTVFIDGDKPDAIHTFLLNELNETEFRKLLNEVGE